MGRKGAVSLLAVTLLLTVTACRSAERAGPGADAAAAAEGAPGSSASRLVFWTACNQVTQLTDADLDRWRSRGVDGFVCIFRSLEGLGGDQSFTADTSADLSADRYTTERTVRDSNVVARAHARGMKLYIGFYLVNVSNPATPLLDWFDDDGWSQRVLPQVSGLAGAARALGFDGLAMDQELYPQAGGKKTASWSWDYPGNQRTEADVRSQVKERGAELMRAMAGAFPGVELTIYALDVPDTYAALMQARVNGVDSAFESSVQIDLLDGMAGVDGYGAIRLLNSIFYKTTHLRLSWDDALRYEYNHLSSLLSQRLTSWPSASGRIFESPFSWISSGTTAFERARDPGEVAMQLDAFSRWGMGGEFANYAYGKLASFDYTDYVPAMIAASTPREVSSGPPTLKLTKPAGASPTSTMARTIDLAGTAYDHYAVWSVTWSNDRGGSGAARMTWDPSPNGKDDWAMRWEIRGVELASGRNTLTITVTSIKGLTSSLQYVIDA